VKDWQMIRMVIIRMMYWHVWNWIKVTGLQDFCREKSSRLRTHLLSLFGRADIFWQFFFQYLCCCTLWYL